MNDFWRRHFYDAPLEFVSYARSKRYSAKAFARLIRGMGSQPDIGITPEPASVTLDSLDAFRAAGDRLCAAWPSVREEVLEKLQDPGLNKVQYGNIPLLAAEMDRWMRLRVFPLPERLLKFSSEKIKKFTKKKCEPPVHPFLIFAGKQSIGRKNWRNRWRPALSF